MSTTIQETFAANVRRLLRTHQMTQVELADRLGCRQPFVGKLVSGDYTPGLGVVEDVAEAFGVPVSDLLENSGDSRLK